MHNIVKIITAALLISVSNMAGYAKGLDGSKPIATERAGNGLKWLATEHNFGAFNEDQGAVTTYFKFINTGPEPIVVLGARATCGCTQPTYPHETINPGDTASISVTYDPAGRPGRFSKKVYVDTSTEPRRTTLTISGVVIGGDRTVSSRYPVDFGPLKFSRSAMLLGTARKTHAKSIFSDGYNKSHDTIRPQVINAPKWLEVTATPQAVPPGERVSFNFFIRPDRTPLYGLVADSVTIVPDAANPALTFTLPVVVTFEEDFDTMTPRQYERAPQCELSTQRVVVKNLNGKNSATQSFTLKNIGGGDPLLVRRVYSTTPGISARVSSTKVDKGKTCTVTVTVEPQAIGPDGVLNARIAVITNSPQGTTQTVRLVGEVTPSE